RTWQLHRGDRWRHPSRHNHRQWKRHLERRRILERGARRRWQLVPPVGQRSCQWFRNRRLLLFRQRELCALRERLLSEWRGDRERHGRNDEPIQHRFYIFERGVDRHWQQLRHVDRPRHLARQGRRRIHGHAARRVDWWRTEHPGWRGLELFRLVGRNPW